MVLPEVVPTLIVQARHGLHGFHEAASDYQEDRCHVGNSSIGLSTPGIVEQPKTFLALGQLLKRRNAGQVLLSQIPCQTQEVLSRKTIFIVFIRASFVGEGNGTRTPSADNWRRSIGPTVNFVVELDNGTE